MQVEVNVSARVSQAHMDVAVGFATTAWTLLCAGDAVDDEIDLQVF